MTKNSMKHLKKIKELIKNNLIKIAVVGGVVVMGATTFTSDSMKAKDISYNDFSNLIKTNNIEEIQVNKDKETLIIKDKDKNVFKIINPGYETFRQECLEQGVTFVETSSFDTFALISTVCSVGVLIFFSRNMNFGQKSKKIDSNNIPKDRFDDLVGLKEVKEYLKLIIKYFKNPDKFSKYGAKMPKGILFYGPSGTGKTKLAKALAGEAGVPFFYASASEFVELLAGGGARKVRHLFEEARKNSPCIIFIDEIDAVGKKRSSNGNNSDSEREQTLNELLTQLDGFQNNEGILTICATNRLDSLDDALIRPGRFSEKVMIPVPRNKEERLQILKSYSSNKTITQDALEYMSKVSTGYSGAKLENFMNECALQQILKDKECIDLEIAENTFFKLETNGTRIVSSEKLETEKKIVAWHESGHALANKLYDIDFIQVTISGSSSGVGGFSLQDNKDNLYPTISHIRNLVKVYYAGRIAESFLLENDITTGASNDIEKASELINNMIKYYGMDRKHTMLNLEVVNDEKYLVNEARIISEELYNEVYEDLKANQDILEEIANTLLEKETLYDNDIEEILNKYDNVAC